MIARHRQTLGEHAEMGFVTFGEPFARGHRIGQVAHFDQDAVFPVRLRAYGRRHLAGARRAAIAGVADDEQRESIRFGGMRRNDPRRQQ